MLTRITVESMTITKQKISLYFVQYLLKSIENILNHLSICLPMYSRMKLWSMLIKPFLVSNTVNKRA